MKEYLRYFVYFILFAILIGSFIYLGKKDYGSNLKKYTDQEKFSLEYTDIPKENMFEYAYANDIVNILEKGNGIVYMGFPSNEWAKYYVDYLYEVFTERKVKTVYYYNPLKDRIRYTKSYKTIENRLNNYLVKLDDDTKRLNTPLLMIVKNGNIVYVNNDTAINKINMTPKDYWDYNHISEFKIEIASAIESSGIRE